MKRKVGRNDPCPCGSGKKYKNCHGTYAVGLIEHEEDEGRGVLHIEHTQRARSYDVQMLITSRAKRPIPQIERVPLALGGASSMPKHYSGLGMFQRVYQCLPGLWDFKEDPKLLLFSEEQYQVELRRKDVKIVASQAQWRTTASGTPVWDVSASPKELAPEGYYCCVTTFVRSNDHPEIERVGGAIADALAGLVSLTVTPDLVRTPIWQATCFLTHEGPNWRVNIRNQVFRVGPPSVVPETFEAVNALASCSISEPIDPALSTALRFMGNETRTELEEDRFVWLYLAIRIVVDAFFQRENSGREPPEQEQRFRFYAIRHFPGESEIIEDFKRVYQQRNSLIKGINPAVFTPDDVRRAGVICHRLLRCELDKRQAEAKAKRM
ncbi:hypothetical protein E3J38_06395 [candidate division TA06 bacterium]|uniref:SEC-C domain-containing protein n=1 Tax=candidate division TA06 bacterium TaxID=2250710 RepID=A0A523XLA8_UNCT6|nr:MAG: hypothetical protein E3J38_06395 [candidate division TA06 bacterium]